MTTLIIQIAIILFTSLPSTLYQSFNDNTNSLPQCSFSPQFNITSSTSSYSSPLCTSHLPSYLSWLGIQLSLFDLLTQTIENHTNNPSSPLPQWNILNSYVTSGKVLIHPTIIPVVFESQDPSLSSPSNCSSHCDVNIGVTLLRLTNNLLSLSPSPHVIIGPVGPFVTYNDNVEGGVKYRENVRRQSVISRQLQLYSEQNNIPFINIGMYEDDPNDGNSEYDTPPLYPSSFANNNNIPIGNVNNVNQNIFDIRQSSIGSVDLIRGFLDTNGWNNIGIIKSVWDNNINYNNNDIQNQNISDLYNILYPQYVSTAAEVERHHLSLLYQRFNSSLLYSTIRVIAILPLSLSPSSSYSNIQSYVNNENTLNNFYSSPSPLLPLSFSYFSLLQQLSQYKKNGIKIIVSFLLRTHFPLISCAADVLNMKGSEYVWIFATSPYSNVSSTTGGNIMWNDADRISAMQYTHQYLLPFSDILTDDPPLTFSFDSLSSQWWTEQYVENFDFTACQLPWEGSFYVSNTEIPNPSPSSLLPPYSSILPSPIQNDGNPQQLNGVYDNQIFGHHYSHFVSLFNSYVANSSLALQRLTTYQSNYIPNMISSTSLCADYKLFYSLFPIDYFYIYTQYIYPSDSTFSQVPPFYLDVLSIYGNTPPLSSSSIMVSFSSLSLLFDSIETYIYPLPSPPSSLPPSILSTNLLNITSPSYILYNTQLHPLLKDNGNANYPFGLVMTTGISMGVEGGGMSSNTLTYSNGGVSSNGNGNRYYRYSSSSVRRSSYVMCNIIPPSLSNFLLYPTNFYADNDRICSLESPFSSSVLLYDEILSNLLSHSGVYDGSHSVRNNPQTYYSDNIIILRVFPYYYYGSALPSLPLSPIDGSQPSPSTSSPSQISAIDTKESIFNVFYVDIRNSFGELLTSDNVNSIRVSPSFLQGVESEIVVNITSRDQIMKEYANNLVYNQQDNVYNNLYNMGEILILPCSCNHSYNISQNDYDPYSTMLISGPTYPSSPFVSPPTQCILNPLYQSCHTYLISYQLSFAGQYDISIQFEGTPLTSSPFPLSVYLSDGSNFDCPYPPSLRHDESTSVVLATSILILLGSLALTLTTTWYEVYKFRFNEEETILTGRIPRNWSDSLIFVNFFFESCQLISLSLLGFPSTSYSNAMQNIFNLSILDFSGFVPQGVIGSEVFWPLFLTFFTMSILWSTLCSVMMISFFSGSDEAMQQYGITQFILRSFFVLGPLLGSGLFQPIMSYFFAVFACPYTYPSGPFMSSDCQTSCWVNYHIGFVIMSIVGISLYYPFVLLARPLWQQLNENSFVRMNAKFATLLYNMRMLQVLNATFLSPHVLAHTIVEFFLLHTLFWTCVFLVKEPYNHRKVSVYACAMIAFPMWSNLVNLITIFVAPNEGSNELILLFLAIWIGWIIMFILLLWYDYKYLPRLFIDTIEAKKLERALEIWQRMGMMDKLAGPTGMGMGMGMGIGAKTNKENGRGRRDSVLSANSNSSPTVRKSSGGKTTNRMGSSKNLLAGAGIRRPSNSALPVGNNKQSDSTPSRLVVGDMDPMTLMNLHSMGRNRKSSMSSVGRRQSSQFGPSGDFSRFRSPSIILFPGGGERGGGNSSHSVIEPPERLHPMKFEIDEKGKVGKVVTDEERRKVILAAGENSNLNNKFLTPKKENQSQSPNHHDGNGSENRKEREREKDHLSSPNLKSSSGIDVELIQQQAAESIALAAAFERDKIRMQLSPLFVSNTKDKHFTSDIHMTEAHSFDLLSYDQNGKIVENGNYYYQRKFPSRMYAKKRWKWAMFHAVRQHREMEKKRLHMLTKSRGGMGRRGSLKVRNLNDPSSSAKGAISIPTNLYPSTLPSCFTGAKDVSLPPLTEEQKNFTNVNLPSRLDHLGRRALRLFAALFPQRVGNSVCGFAPTLARKSKGLIPKVKFQLYVLPSIHSRALARSIILTHVVLVLSMIILFVVYLQLPNISVGKVWIIGTLLSLFTIFQLSRIRTNPDGVLVFCRSLGAPVYEEYMFSYSWKVQAENVRTVARAGYEAGVGVWIDVLKLCPGDDIRIKLMSAVEQSYRVVAFLSPEYTQSVNCCLEFSCAVKRPKNLICCIIKEVGPEIRKYLEKLRLQGAVIVEGLPSLMDQLHVELSDTKDLRAYSWWRKQSISQAGIPSNLATKRWHSIPKWSLKGWPSFLLPKGTVRVGPIFLTGDCLRSGISFRISFLLLTALVGVIINFVDIYLELSDNVHHTAFDYFFLFAIAIANLAPLVSWQSLVDTRTDVHASLRPLMASKALGGHGVRVAVAGHDTHPMVVAIRNFLSDIGHSPSPAATLMLRRRRKKMEEIKMKARGGGGGGTGEHIGSHHEDPTSPSVLPSPSPFCSPVDTNNVHIHLPADLSQDQTVIKLYVMSSLAERDAIFGGRAFQQNNQKNNPIQNNLVNPTSGQTSNNIHKNKGKKKKSAKKMKSQRSVGNLLKTKIPSSTNTFHVSPNGYEHSTPPSKKSSEEEKEEEDEEDVDEDEETNSDDDDNDDDDDEDDDESDENDIKSPFANPSNMFPNSPSASSAIDDNDSDLSPDVDQSCSLFLWCGAGDPFSGPIGARMMRYFVLIADWQRNTLADALFCAIGVKVVHILHRSKVKIGGTTIEGTHTEQGQMQMQGNGKGNGHGNAKGNIPMNLNAKPNVHLPPLGADPSSSSLSTSNTKRNPSAQKRRSTADISSKVQDGEREREREGVSPTSPLFTTIPSSASVAENANFSCSIVTPSPSSPLHLNEIGIQLENPKETVQNHPDENNNEISLLSSDHHINIDNNNNDDQKGLQTEWNEKGDESKSEAKSPNSHRQLLPRFPSSRISASSSPSPSSSSYGGNGNGDGNGNEKGKDQNPYAMMISPLPKVTQEVSHLPSKTMGKRPFPIQNANKTPTPNPNRIDNQFPSDAHQEASTNTNGTGIVPHPQPLRRKRSPLSSTFSEENQKNPFFAGEYEYENDLTDPDSESLSEAEHSK